MRLSLKNIYIITFLLLFYLFIFFLTLITENNSCSFADPVT